MRRNSRIQSFLRRRLNIRHLALIAQLDDARSVAGAAEVAGMSQPAASILLRGFEDALQVPLFERHARGIFPTPYGQIMVRHARAILSEIDHVQEEIASLKSGLSGQASVGSIAGTHLVPIAVGLLKRKHPRLLVNIDVGHSGSLIERLLGRELDIVVARLLDSQSAEELQFEPLAGESLAVMVGSRHPLAGAPGVRLEDLVGELWILPPPGSALLSWLTAMFLQRGLPMPTNVVQTQSPAAMLGLLTTTNAVAALPPEALAPLRDAGSLSVLVERLDIGMSPFGIITRRKHELSPGAKALLDAIRTTATTLYGTGAGP